MEPAETGDPKYNTCIVDKNPDASGAASVDFPEVSDNPFVSKSGDVSSLYFRDHTYSQEPDKEQKSEEDEEEVKPNMKVSYVVSWVRSLVVTTTIHCCTSKEA